MRLFCVVEIRLKSYPPSTRITGINFILRLLFSSRRTFSYSDIFFITLLRSNSDYFVSNLLASLLLVSRISCCLLFRSGLLNMTMLVGFLGTECGAMVEYAGTYFRQEISSSLFRILLFSKLRSQFFYFTWKSDDWCRIRCIQSIVLRLWLYWAFFYVIFFSLSMCFWWSMNFYAQYKGFVCISASLR